MSRDGKATYYDAGGIETYDIVKAKLTQEQYIGFLLGTSLVYQCRLNWKGQAADDARKSANYAVWLAEELESIDLSDMDKLPSSIELIADARLEQLVKHGFDDRHDDKHIDGELIAAAMYLLSDGATKFPDWGDMWRKKFLKKSEIERRVVAAALVAAEVDRLLRAKGATAHHPV
ncbi:MAG: DUF3310 domain-containing protein [Desulfobulbaceae bacterium]|nr:DUF3310 domain-containing protein [Desulfobulbaceae bacterium]